MKRLPWPVGRSPTIDELLERLKAPHPSDRSRAASELGANYHDSRIVEPLIEALNDPDPYARSAAAHSLGRLGRNSKMAPKAKQAVGRLVALLEDEHEEVVASAVYALGELGDSSIGSKLLPYLDYPDASNVKMRNIVILALRALRYQPAIPQFRRLIRDPNPSIRNDAVFALFSMRHINTEVKEILESLIDDPDPLLRERAQGMLEIIISEKRSG